MEGVRGRPFSFDSMFKWGLCQPAYPLENAGVCPQEDPSERQCEGFRADSKNIFTWKARIDTGGQ